MNGQIAEELTCSTVPKGDPSCPWFTTPPKPGAAPDVGQAINLADCNDWNRATAAQRRGTLAQLEGFAGGPIVGNERVRAVGHRGRCWTTRTPTTCSVAGAAMRFARAFKLYKLYERAAALTGAPVRAGAPAR